MNTCKAIHKINEKSHNIKSIMKYGYFEGNTIVGKCIKSYILTLV